MTEPGCWAGIMVMLCTLSMGADVQQALKTPSMPSTVLQRHKRSWRWDKLYVHEETPLEQKQKIGKVKVLNHSASLNIMLIDYFFKFTSKVIEESSEVLLYIV